MEFILGCNVTDLNSIDSEGKTPLYVATENDNKDAVRLLLARPDVDVNKGATVGNRAGASALYIAAIYDNVGMVELLIGHPKMDVNKGRTIDALNALMSAAWDGFTELVKMLLSHPRIDVNKQRQSDGGTPLFLAARYGSEAGITYI